MKASAGLTRSTERVAQAGEVWGGTQTARLIEIFSKKSNEWTDSVGIERSIASMEAIRALGQVPPCLLFLIQCKISTMTPNHIFPRSTVIVILLIISVLLLNLFSILVNHNFTFLYYALWLGGFGVLFLKYQTCIAQYVARIKISDFARFIIFWGMGPFFSRRPSLLLFIH